MSSLHEEVARRSAAEPTEPQCVLMQPGASALVICQWQGESWALAWSQFVAARLCGSDVHASLELSFANYLVTVSGENLRVLLDDIATSRLGCIRDLPAKYQRQMREGATYIARIEVRPLANSSAGETREPS